MKWPRVRSAQLTPDLARALRNPAPPPVAVVLHCTPEESERFHQRVLAAISMPVVLKVRWESPT